MQGQTMLGVAMGPGGSRQLHTTRLVPSQHTWPYSGRARRGYNLQATSSCSRTRLCSIASSTGS